MFLGVFFNYWIASFLLFIGFNSVYSTVIPFPVLSTTTSSVTTTTRNSLKDLTKTGHEKFKWKRKNGFYTCTNCNAFHTWRKELNVTRKKCHAWCNRKKRCTRFRWRRKGGWINVQAKGECQIFLSKVTKNKYWFTKNKKYWSASGIRALTSPTPTTSSSPSSTASISPSPTSSISASITTSPTPSPSSSVSLSPTASVTPSMTATPSVTSSVSPTASSSVSLSPTASQSPSPSTTATPTVSFSESPNPITPSPSSTPAIPGPVVNGIRFEIYNGSYRGFGCAFYGLSGWKSIGRGSWNYCSAACKDTPGCRTFAWNKFLRVCLVTSLESKLEQVRKGNSWGCGILK